MSSHFKRTKAAIFTRLLAACVWVALMTGAHGPASAQSQNPPAPAATAAKPGAVMDARLDKDESALQAMRLVIRNRSADDAALQAQQAALKPIQADLADALSTLTPRLQNVRARLAELGPAPAAGQPPEAPDVAEARARLLRFQKALDDNSKRARLLSVEASQTGDALAQRLRGNFSARLWTHTRSVFDPTLWGDFAAALPGDVERASAAIAGQARQPATARGAAEAWSTILATLGLFLLVPARILLGRLGRRWSISLAPTSALRKSTLALWLTLVGALTPPLAGQLLLAAVSGVVALTPAVEGLARAIIAALFSAATIDALGRSLLSPGRPRWRLAPVSDAFADRLAIFPALIGAAVGLVAFSTRASELLGASEAAREAILCLGVVLQLLAVGGALGVARMARDGQEEEAEAARSRLAWVAAAVGAWLALAAALIAVTVGYVAFASFIMRELIWIATVLASLFLLMRFVDDLCEALFAPRHSLSRVIAAGTGLSDHALEQVGVLLSGVLRLGLMVFGWMAIVAPFGASTREILARATSTEMVFKLGQISISPGLIFGAVFVFAAGLVITRIVRGWLERTYLPKTRIDVGLRTSITAGLTYLGALIALLTTCAYLGVNLDRIALFASALSVGIGFGLQAVIGNFVSGLILLAERPVKVGDWIAIGDQEGDVRRIHIRATEIELGDRSKLIVPNSDLVSKTVRNVTSGGALGQVKIVLRVTNDADAGEVRDLLLKQLTAHPGVLREPPPGVFLTNLPEGALEFTAVAAVASARQAFGIRSDLLFATVAALKTAGVRLASQSTVIQLAAQGGPTASVGETEASADDRAPTQPAAERYRAIDKMDGADEAAAARRRRREGRS
jgi:small-conductance mechanosensitive channel